jgi:hypothetical protein
MTSFEIRKGIGGPIFFLTFLAAYIGFAYVTSMPRGILLLCLIPFFAVGMKLPRYYAAIVIPLILLLIPISTFIKFGEWDPELLLNLLNRIGAQVQYTTYAVFGPNYFPMNKPVWHQFLESLPIIRQYFTSIDETDIFWTISGGYIGGFAVSPELRSLLYWSGSYISFIDVSFMYAIISVMSILIWRISKYHAWYSVICLPMISQMDSINSFSLYLQAVLICGTVQYFSDVIGVRRNNRGNREQNSNNFRLNSRQTTASQNQPLI